MFWAFSGNHPQKKIEHPSGCSRSTGYWPCGSKSIKWGSCGLSSPDPKNVPRLGIDFWCYVLKYLLNLPESPENMGSLSIRIHRDLNVYIKKKNENIENKPMTRAMAMAKITESIKSKPIGSKSLVSIHLKVKLRNSAKCVILRLFAGQ